MKLLCKMKFHKWVYEYLTYSVFRKCVRCGLYQYMNFYPGAVDKWPTLTKEIEKRLREYKLEYEKERRGENEANLHQLTAANGN